MKTWSIGDRVETKARANEPWVPGAIHDIDSEGTLWITDDRGQVAVSRRATWPKVQACRKPAPKPRLLMRPPPPPVDQAALEGVARSLGRQPPQEPREFKPQPKPKEPGRSLEYMAHVRTGACIAANCTEINGTHAHHAGPKGTHAIARKVSDGYCVSLCHECHRFFHDHGHLPGMTRDHTERAFDQAQATTLRSWFDRLSYEEQRDALVLWFDESCRHASE